MELKILAIALIASVGFAQEVTNPPGGGGGSGGGTPNVTATGVGTITSLAVTITPLNLTTLNPALYQCVNSSGVPIAITGVTTSGTSPINTVTFAFTSTATPTCTVNASGGAGSSGTSQVVTYTFTGSETNHEASFIHSSVSTLTPNINCYGPSPSYVGVQLGYNVFTNPTLTTTYITDVTAETVSCSFSSGAVGSNNATTINGAAVPANAVLGSNGSSQPINATRAVSLSSGLSVLADLPSIKDPAYGALGNGIILTNSCSVSNGGTNVTCSGASFTSADNGKDFFIYSSTNYITTITNVTGATTFTASSTAPTAYGSHTAIYGSDDTAAFTAAAAAGNGANFTLPTGSYFISSPVSFGLQRLFGRPGVVINCINITGACLTFDYNSSTGNGFSAGMEKVSMIGPGVSAMTCLQLGGTNGASDAYFEGLRVSTCGNALDLENGTNYLRVSHSFFTTSTHDLYVNMPNASIGGESIFFDHDVWQYGGPDQGTTNISGCIDVHAGNLNMVWDAGSMVVCQFAIDATITNATLSIRGVHMENGQATTQPYINVADAGTTLYIDGGFNANIGFGGSGPASFATVSAGLVNISNINMSNFGPTASVFALSGSGYVQIGTGFNIGGFSAPISGSSSSSSTIYPQAGAWPTVTTGTTTLTQLQSGGLCNGIGGTFNLQGAPFDGETVTIRNINAGGTATCTVTGNAGNIFNTGSSTASVTLYPTTSQTYTWNQQNSLWLVTSGNQVYNDLKAVDAGGTCTLSGNQLSCPAANYFISGGGTANIRGNASTNGIVVTASAVGFPLPANTQSTSTSQSGTSGTAACSMGFQGHEKVTTCYLSAYANTSTAQTYAYPTAFSTVPVILESAGSCGTYNPTTTASTLTLPANASMTAETCNIVVIGQ